MPDLKWSHSEKKHARRAFDAALETALSGVIAEFKAKAAAVATIDELWAVEDYLGQQRRNLADLFDYRYSQLCFVFAQLIHLGHLTETQLTGLSDEKLGIIRDMRDLMKRR